MGVESAEYNDHDLQSVASEVCGLYACYFVAHGPPELKPHTVELSDPNKNQQQPKTSTTTTYHQEESRCLTNKTSLLLMFFVKPSPCGLPPSARAISAIRFGPSDPGLSDHDLPTPKVNTFWHARFQLLPLKKGGVYSPNSHQSQREGSG